MNEDTTEKTGFTAPAPAKKAAKKATTKQAPAKKAAGSKPPAQDPSFGDLTPEYVEWFIANKTAEEVKERYSNGLRLTKAGFDLKKLGL